MRAGWIVLNVLSGSEMKTAAGINAAGLFDCYCPTFKTWLRLPRHIARKEGRSRRLVEAALLPGYIFGKTNYDELNCPSIRLKFKEFFGPMKSVAGNVYVSDADIIRLRSLQDLGQLDENHKDRVKPVVRVVDYVGKSVMIISGPFEGLTGEVTDMRGNELKIDAGNKIWVSGDLVQMAC